MLRIESISSSLYMLRFFCISYPIITIILMDRKDYIYIYIYIYIFEFCYCLLCPAVYSFPRTMPFLLLIFLTNASFICITVHFSFARKCMKQIQRSTSVLGIDIGDTQCRAALLADDIQEIGKEMVTIPMSVYVGDDDALAPGVDNQNVSSTFFHFKKLLGRHNKDPHCEEMSKELPFFYFLGPNSAPSVELHSSEKKIQRRFFVEELLAAVLREVKCAMEVNLERDITLAVISVPPYFEDSARQATLNAAQLAGLQVIRIISDASALLMASIFEPSRGYAGNERKQTVAVLDFGYSSTSASVFSTQGYSFSCLRSVGSIDLGTTEIDRKLATYCCSNFLKEYSISPDRVNCHDWWRLRRECNASRCLLSSNDLATISVADFLDGKDLHCTITRGTLTAIFGEMMIEIKKMLDQLFESLEFSPQDVNAIVIGGKGGKTPCLRQLICGYFHSSKKVHFMDSDRESCAVGSSIVGFSFKGYSSFPNIRLSDCIASSLDVKMMDYNRLLSIARVERFTPLPHRCSFPVKNFGGSLFVDVNNKVHSRIRFSIPTPAVCRVVQQHSSQRSVMVSCQIDENGVVQLFTTDFSGKRISYTGEKLCLNFATDSQRQALPFHFEELVGSAFDNDEDEDLVELPASWMQGQPNTRFTPADHELPFPTSNEKIASNVLACLQEIHNDAPGTISPANGDAEKSFGAEPASITALQEWRTDSEFSGETHVSDSAPSLRDEDADLLPTLTHTAGSTVAWESTTNTLAEAEHTESIIEVTEITGEPVPAATDVKVLGTVDETTNIAAAAVMSIDWGTACRVSVLEVSGGVVRPLKQFSMPSYVAFDTEMRPLVGRCAQAQLLRDPTCVVFDFKRFIGRHALSPLVVNGMRKWPFGIREGSDGRLVVDIMPVLSADASTDRREFHVEELLGLLFRAAMACVEGAGLAARVQAAALVVPACFGDSQREAVLRAAALADLPHAQLCHEPTAVMMAYRHYAMLQAGLCSMASQRVAVLCFGATTTECTVFHTAADGGVSALTTAGCPNLGGEDMDVRLALHYVPRLLGSAAPAGRVKSTIDVPLHPGDMMKLRHACEAAKRELSAAPMATLRLEDWSGESSVTRRVSRMEVEEVCHIGYDRALQAVEDALKLPGSGDTVDVVLLAGGMCRTPRLMDMAAERFGKSATVLPLHTIAPKGEEEFFVAFGAALSVSALASLSSAPLPLEVRQEIASRDIVLLFREDASPRCHPWLHLPLTLPLPATRRVALTDVPASAIHVVCHERRLGVVLQTTFTITVSQQEKQQPTAPEPNTGAEAPPGVDVGITFHVDRNGIFSLQAEDRRTNRLLDVTNDKLCMAPEQLQGIAARGPVKTRLLIAFQLRWCAHHRVEDMWRVLTFIYIRFYFYQKINNSPPHPGRYLCFIHVIQIPGVQGAPTQQEMPALCVAYNTLSSLLSFFHLLFFFLSLHLLLILPSDGIFTIYTARAESLPSLVLPHDTTADRITLVRESAGETTTSSSSDTQDGCAAFTAPRAPAAAGAWRAPHPVTLVRTVATGHDRVLVMAGGPYISAAPLYALCNSAALGPASRVGCPTSRVPAGENACLDAGEVTCLAVCGLPASECALAIAGTTHGTLAVLLVGRCTVHKVSEVALAGLSRGAVGLGESLRDVTIGMDPAGRPEFVAAATQCALIVADIQQVVDGLTETRCGLSFDASQIPGPRPVSETLVATFPESSVVRLLCPTRCHAAFTMDIALVVILSSGTVRYVERDVSGGAVALLREHHYQRQGTHSAYGFRQGQADVDAPGNGACDGCHPPAIPHVLYSYRLATLAVETCTARRAGAAVRSGVTVNDAALVYNEASGCMDLVLVGAQQQAPTGLGRTSPRPGSPMRRTSGTLGAVALGVHSGPLPSRLVSGGPVAPPASSCSVAWWALTERAVLPLGTLYSMAKRWCRHYHGEDHICTLADCVTSFAAHTVSRAERLSGLGGGSSGLAALAPAPDGDAGTPMGIVAMGSDLFLGAFAAVQQPSQPASELGPSDTAPGLPALQHLASTGHRVVEAIAVDWPAQAFPASTPLDCRGPVATQWYAPVVVLMHGALPSPPLPFSSSFCAVSPAVSAIGNQVHRRHSAVGSFVHLSHSRDPMDETALELAGGLCNPQYIRSGVENLSTVERQVRSILAQRRCPETGLSDMAIEHLLSQLALMDANNFEGHIGGGEREGRVIAPLVRRRAMGFAHGIGRSGNLTENQPKAAGSSLLYTLTNALVLDLLRLSGAPSFGAALCVPLATGMTLALVLRAVEKDRRRELAAGAVAAVEPRVVIWPRVDQKTALKCIDAAGFEAEVVPLRRAAPAEAQHAGSHPFYLAVDPKDVMAAVERVGRERVLCIVSTTSCFAPRLPDDVVAIARYAKAVGVPYVINNAYGTQSRSIMRRIEAAQREHRVDYVVQSGDKNFLVPVGGAIVCSASKEKVGAVGQLYAGRAGVTPILDLFITALHLGRRGMQRLWDDRMAVLAALLPRVASFAKARREVLVREDMVEVQVEGCGGPAGQRRICVRDILGGEPPHKQAAVVKRNDISLAVTMQHFGVEEEYLGRTVPSSSAEDHERGEWYTVSPLPVDVMGRRNSACRAFGAKLFRSRVTGPRVIVPAPDTLTTVAGAYPFRSYGCHEDQPACPMLVMACGIGMTHEEVDGLLAMLEKLWPCRQHGQQHS
eukprot:gene12009-8271_t